MTTSGMDNALDPGTALADGWLGPGLMILAALVVTIAIIAILRERYHRRRRDDLQNRLADLENIIVGLSIASTADAPKPVSSDSTAAASVITSQIFAPRGPLSTAISTMRSDLGPELPGPDRIDLRATCFVYEHLEEALNPADLADGLHLSLRSVQRGLSRSLGCTPRELILAVKMREAKRRLLEEALRVQEAARAVGYDDPFHFSRRFKAYYGMSPTQMQNRADRSVA
mgnify:CR=1 FL=1